MTAQSYLDLNLITVVKDDLGRKLDSFTSVQLEWFLSNADLDKLNEKDIVFDMKQVDGYPVLGRGNDDFSFPFSHFHLFNISIVDSAANQLLKPSGLKGPLDVTVKIIGYKESALRQLGLNSQPNVFDIHSTNRIEDDDSKLSYTLDLILVDDVTIQPNQQSLFNNVKNKVNLQVDLV